MSVPPRGLPEHLPEGERLLWQGAPDWRTLAQRTFHARKIAAYFAVIVLWMAGSALRDSTPLTQAGMTVLRAAAVGAVPVALICAYAWIVSRMTVYNITDRRVVLRVGIALPITINIPFSRISGADLAQQADGSGGIALSLAGTDRLAYAVIWPHARPWRFGRPEPMLRGLRDVRPVAQLLARALAASADMAVPVMNGAQVDAASRPHVTAPA